MMMMMMIIVVIVVVIIVYYNDSSCDDNDNCNDKYRLPECIILYFFQTRKIGLILPSLNEFDRFY
jgi:hypothetical protein